MRPLFVLVKRNVRLFMKDKGVFFTSLITPFILLLLYVTFLGKVYRMNFISGLPDGIEVSEKLISGFVGGQLSSSILSVSCITVAFCSNMIMVADKANGTIKDLTITPVKKSTLALSYFIATFLNTFAVCLIGMIGSWIYLGISGWYLSFADAILILVDVFLMTLFGTACSSFVNSFLSSQGQISAVGTIVSSCYGFISGAYMPLSSYASGLSTVLKLLPGTYGTFLFRNHYMNAAIEELQKETLMPAESISELKQAFDVELVLFDRSVSVGTMYLIVVFSIAVFIGAYVLVNVLRKKKTAKS